MSKIPSKGQPISTTTYQKERQTVTNNDSPITASNITEFKQNKNKKLSKMITREALDKQDKINYKFKVEEGLSEAVVRKISEYKKEPEWMLKKRLQSLKTFHDLKFPEWGPNISELDLNKITYFMIPEADPNQDSWDKVPDEIKQTFQKLGIPEAEQKALAGAGAQYDSQVVYHNLREDLKKQGVIFEDFDVAVKEYPDLVQKYYMKCVSPNLHKFAALHGAVTSGGTFIYIPKGIKVDLPLQAYFRMNMEAMGQFEHTLIIVDEEAQLHYVEGCFTEGNLVATNPDYKRIEEITEKDKILTSEGDYKKAKDLQKYKFTGDIYEVRIKGDSTQVISATPEHPFLYVDKTKKHGINKLFAPRWNIPKYFKEGDYLAMPINKKTVKKSHHEFEVKKGNGKGKWTTEKVIIPAIPEFFRLVGYYLAEGSTISDNYLCFDFNSNEREYIEDVKQCLKKVFNLQKIYELKHKKNNGTSVRVNSTKLARVFRQLGHRNYNKALLPWMMYETKQNQEEIAKGWFRGDGNYYKRRHKSGFKEVLRVNTTSYKLVRQMRDLFLRLGVFSFINGRNRVLENRRTMYTLGISGKHMPVFGKIVGIEIQETLNGKKRASMFSIDEKFAYVPIKNITKRAVDDMTVYNFGVEDHQTYTVAGVATHNCSASLLSRANIHAGCVEIFVGKNARMRYSSIENWSKNTYNLNTKRAIVEENGIMEWVGGNMGSNVSMLYPATLLKGKNSHADHLSIAYAGKGQNQDTGAKVYHLADNTTSTVKSKSISKDGGITSYRGLIKIRKGSKNAKSSINCDALMFDNKSQSNTYPSMDIEEPEADVVHEASVGRISEEQLFYLMSRGLSEEQATQMIVSGFIEPLVKELPLEYAIELNRLIELEMEHSLG